ncbi:type IX secretion system protein PorD [Chitinophaga caeni]|nr:DUF4835 family protein [Chitinophaga caeni]
MLRKLLILFTGMFCCLSHVSTAQELRANVSVVANQISASTDKKIFTTLQAALKEFLNNRKWSDDVFTTAEKIECNFMLNITQDLGSNQYKATLTVQATRPVYNSGYLTSLLNTQDGDVAFKYIEYQPLEFSDNRVVANDPMVSNLTAIFAYYAYLVLGLDYDSFSPRGGDVFFRKAQNIVNNAPEGKDVSGWKAFEGNNNRYWLQDNLLNARFSRFHEVMYQYHRMGLDNMSEDLIKGRAAIMNCLNLMQALYNDNPNNILLQMFFRSKADELQKIYAKAPPQEKARAVEILSAIDVPNAQRYQALKSATNNNIITN